MKLEDQVCSLELAKRLKELGVKQESNVYWCETSLNSVRESFLCSKNEFVNALVKNFHSAFTVAELGEMLPVGPLSQRWKSEPEMEDGHWTGGFKRIFWGNSNGSMIVKFEEDTEANARAKMLIYLIENKLINLGEPNE